jgi:hypothetical protein
MTHTFRDSLIQLNNDLIIISEHKSELVQNVFRPYNLRIQYLLHAFKHMHDQQSLYENPKEFFHKRIKILEGLFGLSDNSFLFHYGLPDKIDMQNNMKEDIGFIMTE